MTYQPRWGSAIIDSGIIRWPVSFDCCCTVASNNSLHELPVVERASSDPVDPAAGTCLVPPSDAYVLSRVSACECYEDCSRVCALCCFVTFKPAAELIKSWLQLTVMIWRAQSLPYCLLLSFHHVTPCDDVASFHHATRCDNVAS